MLYRPLAPVLIPSIPAERDSRVFRSLLRSSGLRPTRQRVAIVSALFTQGARHVTADILFRQMQHSDHPVSLATIYNTLNQFADVGLVRRIAVNGGRTYFDTDSGDHQHFYIEAEERIVDIPPGAIQIAALPPAPADYEIVSVDVVIRLRSTSASRHPVNQSVPRAEECLFGGATSATVRSAGGLQEQNSDKTA